MNLELLKIVILLCSINSNSPLDKVEKYQLECQQWYVDCVYDQISAQVLPPEARNVKKCMKMRKIYLSK